MLQARISGQQSCLGLATDSENALMPAHAQQPLSSFQLSKTGAHTATRRMMQDRASLRPLFTCTRQVCTQHGAERWQSIATWPVSFQLYKTGAFPANFERMLDHGVLTLFPFPVVQDISVWNRHFGIDNVRTTHNCGTGGWEYRTLISLCCHF